MITSSYACFTHLLLIKSHKFFFNTQFYKKTEQFNFSLFLSQWLHKKVHFFNHPNHLRKNSISGSGFFHGVKDYLPRQSSPHSRVSLLVPLMYQEGSARKRMVIRWQRGKRSSGEGNTRRPPMELRNQQ